jgi:hypothetical protein
MPEQMPDQYVEKQYLSFSVSLKFLFYILLVLASALYGIYCYTRLAKPFRILVVLILTVFVSECSGRLLTHYYGSSIPAYHILILLQMILYPGIYLQALPPRKTITTVVVILAVSGFCLSVLNSLFLQTVFIFPSYGILFLSLLIVGLALLSFYFMLQQPADVSPVKDSLFWFNVGNLFFYCTTFFIFGFFTPLLKQSGNLLVWGYNLIYIANLGLYTCYFTALRLQKKST